MNKTSAYCKDLWWTKIVWVTFELIVLTFLFLFTSVVWLFGHRYYWDPDNPEYEPIKWLPRVFGYVIWPIWPLLVICAVYAYL